MARRLTPQEIIERDKRVALRTSSAASKRRLIKLLRKANDRLASRFENVSALRGAGTDTFSRTQSNVVMRQLREVMKELRVGMRNDIVTAGKETATSASRDSMQYLNAAEKKYRGIVAELPVKQAMIVDRVNAGVESSILHRIETDPKDPRRSGVLDRYDTNVIRTFEEELQLRLLARQPWNEVRDSLTKASPFLKGKPAYWAERIVRTETMYAHNRASLDTIREANEQLGDMLKILSATFDDRTGADSLAVHGQIRRTNEPFQSWFGSYMHPPNRPNDREVVVPHRMSWPLPPELEPVSDAEVSARWTKEGRKGSPPPRPKLSTVDRKMIGKVEPPPIREPKGEKLPPPPKPPKPPILPNIPKPKPKPKRISKSMEAPMTGDRVQPPTKGVPKKVPQPTAPPRTPQFYDQLADTLAKKYALSTLAKELAKYRRLATTGDPTYQGMARAYEKALAKKRRMR